MNSGNSKKYINKNRLRLLEEYDMLFKKYARSCSIISNYKLIPFELYKRHMKKLIILLHFIHQIYRITFKKNMPQFNMFDHQIMQRYNNADKIDSNFVYFSVPINETNIITRIEPQNLIPIAYNYNNAADSMFIVRFSDSKSDKQKGGYYNEYNEKILYSTIMHRCIRLSFKGNKIIFNGEQERKYMEGEIDNLEYAKYMSILPSHITLNIVNFAEDDIDIIPFFDNNIKEILQKINVLHRNFQEDYSIMYDNKNFQTQFNNIKGYCDDENTLKTIIYTINNNNDNNVINKDYYYWFQYNSPLPAITILDTETYVFGIHTFQPLNMSKLQLSNIKQNYIGTREPYSKLVNASLQNYIANGLVMEKEAYKRVRYLLKFCSDTTYNIKRNKKTIYVFHGSHRDFHSDYNSDIVLTSFLSCTFNINVALRYAYENSKNNGVVYIIEVKDEIKYINFNDEFSQIILPPGLKIIVSNVLVVGNVKYNFCKVCNHEDKEYIDILYNNIFEGGKGRKLYNIRNYKIYNDKDNYPQTISIHDDIHLGNKEYTFICLGTQINEDVSFNTFFNVKYTLHQHFINECYKFFKINVVDYAIYYETDKFYTVFKNDDNYEIINEISREYENFGYNFENLFIDSLLHNEEALYPRNYMKNKKRRFEYKLYSLRGAGLFDYEGFKKINYNIHEPSKLYMNIVREYISRIEGNLYINDITKQYLELLIDKNIGDFKLFRYNFLDMLKDNYINFIDVNMNIDKTTEEYNELVTMFEELVAIMKLNAEYYINNMENGSIYKEVEPYIYDHKKTGGGEMRTNTNVLKALKTLKTLKILKTLNTLKTLKTLKTLDGLQTETDKSFTTYDNKGYAISNDDYEKFIKRIKKLNEPI
jgi:hypothetical protein